jgi:signal transduction histidine kinase
MVEASETGDLDVGAAVAEVRARALTQRLRLIAIACMTVIGMLIVASIGLQEALPPLYTPLRVLGFTCLAVFVSLTYLPGFVRRQQLWGWLLVTSVASLAAWGGYRRGNPAVAAILESMLVLLTSAILPWGLAMQAACIASCSVLLAAVGWGLSPYPPNDPNLPILVDASASFILALFVAQATRTAFDRAAAENLRLQEARARIRTLADELEAMVRSRTAELEATLADQRAMTRAISHDLRQPLRHIGGFTQMLTDELSEQLDPDHRDQMSRVCRATARMDRMVDALLEISRVAGKPLEQQRIDLTSLSRDLGETLARAEPDRTVDLSIQEGLAANGDPGLVRNMMHALLANAWKFTRGRLSASVEVGRQQDVFFVRDNGSGFDMQHASKLFGTFERLHRPDEFEGEGVGLAIAERVVRRHGGRIWAESRPGGGSTFFFTLRPDGA